MGPVEEEKKEVTDHTSLKSLPLFELPEPSKLTDSEVKQLCSEIDLDVIMKQIFKDSLHIAWKSYSKIKKLTLFDHPHADKL